MSVVALARPQKGLSERITDLVEAADYRRADTPEEREAIYRLRYDAYLSERSILPNAEERFTDPFDETGNAWIFGIHLDGKLVSSIRLHVGTQEYPELPSARVFPEYLLPQLAAGKIIIDPTRHVVDRHATRRYPQLVYLTMRLGWIAAEYFRSDMVLAAVRVEHQAFYKRTFGHQLVWGARPYPLLEKPISLMTLDYFAERDRVNRGYPFFRSTFFERRMMFERLQEPMKLAEQLRTPLRVIGTAEPARKIL